MTVRQSIDSGRTPGIWLRAQLLLPALLVLAWLLWSGMFTSLLLGFGALSCALTLYAVKRMGYLDAGVFALHYNLRLISYWGWLLVEIIKSSIEVVGIVLSPQLRVNPEIVAVEADNLDLMDQVLLGNSITLTPGTLTIDAHHGRLFVHALTPQGAHSLREGEMKQRVTALRGAERG